MSLSVSGKRDFAGQRQRRRTGPSHSTDRQQRQSARTKTRQFGAIYTTPGNLCLMATAWWGWEDSNFQPNDYQPLALTIFLSCNIGAQSPQASCHNPADVALGPVSDISDLPNCVVYLWRISLAYRSAHALTPPNPFINAFRPALGCLQRATYRRDRTHLLIVFLSAASPHVQRITAQKGSAFLSNGRLANSNACRSSLVVHH
jgi:hypothetical protein